MTGPRDRTAAPARPRLAPPSDARRPGSDLRRARAAPVLALAALAWGAAGPARPQGPAPGELAGTAAVAPEPVPTPRAGLRVTKIANCGYLLEAGGTKVLVDALFARGVPGYGRPDPDTLADLRGARGAFADVDLVLASHVHPDHFQADVVLDHLRANPRTTFVSSAQTVAALGDLTDAPELAARVLPCTPPDGERRRVAGAPLGLTVMPISHGREGVENLGLLFELGGLRVLHVGDMNAMARDLTALRLPDDRVDLAFLPDWTLAYGNWHDAVEEQVRAATVIPMHAPPRTVRHEPAEAAGGWDAYWRRLEGRWPNLRVLEEPGASLDLAPAPPSTVDVYRSGDGPYHTYRIPSLVRATDGTLLAFAEARRHGAGDSGDVDLVLRRSTDDGRTWGPLQVLWDDGANTCGNPCAVVLPTGRVLLVATHNLGTDHEAQLLTGEAEGARTAWLLTSDDHGATFTPARPLGGAARRPEWGWLATGPGNAIVLRHGEHAGRVVVPCDHSRRAGEGEAATRGGAIYRSHLLLSDDGGETWRLGAEVGPHVNECQVAETARGELLLDLRSYRGTGCRAEARSRDGGETLVDLRDAPGRPGPVCQASLVAAPDGSLWFTGPDGPGREHLVLRGSFDGGATWPACREVHAGAAAYSSLCPRADGTLDLLFESDGYGRIRFAHLDGGWTHPPLR